MLRNLRWGVGWGLFAGAFFSIIVGIVALARGGLPPDAPPLWLVIAVYAIGGLIGGATVGLLRPWLTTEFRVLTVAPVVMFPAVAGFLLIAEGGVDTWDGPTWVAAVGTSIILGIMGGHQVWKVVQFKV